MMQVPEDIRDAKPELRILILEDNPFDAELIEDALREGGLVFISKIVDNELGYIKALREFRPDLILSDYDLPRFSGWEALQIKKELTFETPFILVTGAVGEERAIQVLTNGATDYVLKSNLSRLLPSVDRVLKESFEHQARKRAEEELREAHKSLEQKVKERTEELQSEIEARRQAEVILKRNNERLGILSYTAERLLGSERPQQIVEEICRRVMAFLDCHAFFNYLLENNSESLRLNAYAGIPEEEALKITDLDFGVAVCGCVARDQIRLVAEDIANHPDERTELVKSFGIQAYACHPLMDQGKLIGTLSFGTKTRTSFSPDDLAVMKAVTDLVAVAMGRVKMDDEVRLSEEKFSIAFADNPAAIALTKLEDGSFVDVNETWVELNGYSRDEAIGRSGRTMRIWPSTQASERFVQELQSKGCIHRWQQEFYKRSGELFVAELSAKVLPFRDEKLILTTMVDITERRRAEHALSESEERFRVAQELSPDGFTILRPVRNGKGQVVDFTWVYENTAMARLNGTDPGMVKGKRLLDELPGYRGTAVFEAYRKAAETGETCVLDDLYHGESLSKPIWFRLGIVSVGADIAILAQDITERKQAEEERLRAHAREKWLARFPEENINPVVRASFDGTILYCNPASMRLPEWACGPGEKIRAPLCSLLEQAVVEGKTIEQDLKLGGNFYWVSAVPFQDERYVNFYGRDVTARKLAEDSARSSEEKFSKAFYLNVAGMTITRLSDGLILEANDRICEMMGRSRGEVIGKTSLEINYWKFPEDRAQAVRRLQESGQAIEGEYAFLRNNGEQWTGLMMSQLGSLEGEQVIFNSTIDITERKRSEEELLQSERRLRKFFDSDMVGTIYWNMDGKIEDANDKFLKMMGYTREELVNGEIDWVKMTPPEYGHLDEMSVEELTKAGVNSRPFEKEYICKNGTRVPVIVTGAMLDEERYHGVAFVLDITERKQYEEAVKESEQRWLTTLASIGDAVIATDNEGRITFMNPVAEKLTGWPLGEVKLQPVAKVFHIINEQTRQTAENPVAKVLEEGLVVGLANHTVLIGKSGVEIPIDDSGAPIMAGNGKVAGVVLVFRDITESKKTQAEIAHLASFPMLDPNPVTEVDATGKIHYMNPAAEKLLHDVRRSSRKHPWLSSWEDVLYALLEEGTGQFEREIKIGRDWYSQSMNFVEDTGRIRIYGRLVTERKEAEQALRESEERFRLALLNSPVAVAIQDRNLRYVWAYNQRSVPSEDIVGKLDEDIFAPEEARHLRALKTRVLQEGIKLQEQMWFDRPAGRIFLDLYWEPVYDEAGRVLGVGSATVNLTPIKLAEEALQTTMQRFHNVLSSMYAAVLLVGNDGRIEYANDAFCEYFKLNEFPGELTGLTSAEMLGKIGNAYRDPDEALARIAQIVRIGEPVKGEEVNFSDGRTYLRDFIPITINRTSHGRLWHHQDITARKRTEELLSKRTLELEAANKELESFAYTVSHDLRAPLRAIDGFAKMLSRGIKGKLDNEEIRKFDVIQENAQKMGKLIDELLAFSRLDRQELSFSVFSMADLVKQVWKECIGINTGRTKALKISELPQANGDSGLMKQVLSNLIGNAVKFTRSREKALIEIGGRMDGHEIIYFVRDNGVGFDMRYYDKLFGVFQRLHHDDDFEGTGVGLAIVQRIIHRHGGRVWAEGTVGEGAAFYFTLPRA